MRRTLPGILVGVAVVCGLAIAGLTRVQEGDGPAPGRALVSWTGSESRAEPGYVRLTTAEAWKAFWLTHQGDRVEQNSRAFKLVPEIDFGTCMVLAFVRGPTTSCDGEELKSADETEGVLRLRFENLTYQTASFGPGRAPSPPTVHPYGIWVLPRSAKPVIIEENVQGLIAGPPLWQERKRFEALGAN